MSADTPDETGGETPEGGPTEPSAVEANNEVAASATADAEAGEATHEPATGDAVAGESAPEPATSDAVAGGAGESAPEPATSGAVAGESAPEPATSDAVAGAATAEAASPESASPESASPESASPEAASPEVPAPEVPAPAPTPATAAPAAAAVADSVGERPNRRKIREGLVLSVAMDKTAVVGVVERVRHPRYAKTVQRTKAFYAHDPNNDLQVGDRVRIAETRPMSKLKRWRIIDILERAK
jgi:small subunit ribosomal protein S17